MITLRGLLAAMILTVLALVYLNAQADGALTLKITPPESRSKKTDYTDVMSVTTNADGSFTVLVYACGTLIEVTGSREAQENPDAKSIAAVKQAVAVACANP